MWLLHQKEEWGGVCVVGGSLEGRITVFALSTGAIVSMSNGVFVMSPFSFAVA